MTRHTTAFYTPEHVAKLLVRKISIRRPAIVIDPSCGEGELLAAVINQHGSAGLSLVGVDTNRRALAKCRNRLRAAGVKSIRLYHGDFLKLADSILTTQREPIYVVMNPPFISYKRLNQPQRNVLRSRVPSLTGRFNLADAFVLLSAAKLKPVSIVSILPCSTGARLETNEHLAGWKAWHSLPDKTFAATISTGFMLWRTSGKLINRGSTACSPRNFKKKTETPEDRPLVFVRNGVATGADKIFLKMAENRSRRYGGIILPCARGREIARAKRLSELPRIWMPTRNSRDAKDSLTRRELLRLKDRHCVKHNGKAIFAYHSAVPDWFRGKRKLIVPEICRRITILDDKDGQVLPLHSTLAIYAQSLRGHQTIKKILRQQKTWTALKRQSERMVGGAIRLTAPLLTAVITRSLKARSRKSRLNWGEVRISGAWGGPS